MEHNLREKKSLLLPFCAALVLWFLELLMFVEIGTKPIVVLLGAVGVALLLLRNSRRLLNVSTLLWGAYVAFAGLSAIWAMSGKFFLREYVKQFLAFFALIYVVSKPVADRSFVQRVLRVLSSISAWIAVLSVEAASIGIVKGLLHSMSIAYTTLDLGYWGRLYGIYGNPNVEASIYALGILAALACMAGARTKRERIFDMVCCSLSAFAFLLCISMGATMCFALAVVVYLITAGRERVHVLLRMLFVAVPTLVFAVVSVPFFNGSAVLKILPLLLMAANAAVSMVLELRVMSRLSAVMEKHAKLPFVVMISLVALVVVYCIAAVNLTGPVTFQNQGGTIRRADYTAPGTHTVEIVADGPVNLWVESQSRHDILVGNHPIILDRTGIGSEPVTLTIPENSTVCFYSIYAESGVKISSVSIDGGSSLPLKYPLLPSFVADRLQGAWASSSLIIRQALWDYGMRLFRLSPVVGNGYGAFESGVSRVEDFFFESKYVHNHYIEVLLCTGVIGFALYVSALVSMAVLLVKKRKFIHDEELGWVYPMLVSVFVMIVTVTLWDIVMSRTMYIAMAFAVFGILVRLLATPLCKAENPDAALSKKEKEALSRQQHTRDLVMRGAWAVLPVVFLVTVAGNMMASNMLHRPVSSYDAFFANLKMAAELDAYEYNDAKLSYVMGVLNDETLTEMYLDQANLYAEEMMQVQSNSLPCYLEEFYIATNQFERAMEAARLSAVYSAADPSTWNQSFANLWGGVVLNDVALAANYETLMPLLAEYRQSFDARNANALDTVELEEPALSAYGVIAELERLEQEQGIDAAKAFLQEVLDSYNKAVEEAIANGEA